MKPTPDDINRIAEKWTAWRNSHLDTRKAIKQAIAEASALQQPSTTLDIKGVAEDIVNNMGLSPGGAGQAALEQILSRHVTDDAALVDRLEAMVFRNREGEKQLNFEFTAKTLREAHQMLKRAEARQ